MASFSLLPNAWNVRLRIAADALHRTSVRQLARAEKHFEHSALRSLVWTSCRVKRLLRYVQGRAPSMAFLTTRNKRCHKSTPGWTVVTSVGICQKTRRAIEMLGPFSSRCEVC